MFALYEFLGRRSFIDPICCNSCMVLSMFWGWFWPILYFLCETSTWHLDSCPPEDTWYGVILWVLRVLGQGLNQSARIFFIRAFSGCYAILTSPKKGETAVYDYNPALFWVLSVSCWCLAELISRGTISIAVFCLQNLICLQEKIIYSSNVSCGFEKVIITNLVEPR